MGHRRERKRLAGGALVTWRETSQRPPPLQRLISDYSGDIHYDLPQLGPDLTQFLRMFRSCTIARILVCIYSARSGRDHDLGFGLRHKHPHVVLAFGLG